MLQRFRRFAAALGLFYGAAANELQELPLQIEVRLPQLAIVHTLNALPDSGLAAVLVPARAQMPDVKAKHLRREPSGNVYAIGDVPDGNGVLGLTGVEAGPHRARHFAVQSGNSVGAAGSFRPSTVMQKSSALFSGFSRPSAKSWS